MTIEEFLADTVSFAGHDLDLKMKSYLPKLGGTFVDCGAYDGVVQSNTLIFERFANWTGILIEASTNRALECAANRPRSRAFNCCLVSRDYPDNVIAGDFVGTLRSSINGRQLKGDPIEPPLVLVPARTLSSILGQCQIQTIDLLSVDVEGSECDVLSGLDLQRWRPQYILIEVLTRNQPELFTMLHNHRYKMICNMTNFNEVRNPGWDGTHDDFLFEAIT